MAVKAPKRLTRITRRKLATGETGPGTAAAPAGVRAARKRKRAIEPMEDYGWFGPDSVTWRVWSYPSSPTVGFSRAVVVEELDPFLVAPVTASSKIYSQPRIRYDRTLRYFATLFFADSRKVVKASEMLMKVHAKAGSVEPVSGLWSDPNNPDQQLWIHLTAWHSALYAYEAYGPGKLSAEDEARYWQECAIAAQAQTIDPNEVPRSREGVREYFERMRPRLAASEATQQAMDHLMNAEVIFPPMPLVLRPAAWMLAKTLRVAIIATLPRWQRELANLRQPRLVDAAIRPVMRLSFRLVDTSPKLKVLIVGLTSPATVPIAAPMLLGIKPEREDTLTPADSFKRHGVPTPAGLYSQLKVDQSTVIYSPSAPAKVPQRQDQPVDHEHANRSEQLDAANHRPAASAA
jgi:uncharacterized protein (DUF2236 family)